MKSAQVGWTEILNNVVGFHISHDPAPILVMQPTLDMAETWSKDRLSPMLRDTPVLRDKVAPARARDSGNTMLHKRYPGGHVTAVGANSPSSLASRPIRILLADEVDRYPASAGAEGDPISLGVKRTTTFWNRKILIGGTPTIKGLSRIEQEWLASDQRRYFTPCPHCDEYQILEWSNVQWPDGNPGKAAIHCVECGTLWSEADRLLAVRNGEWRATQSSGSFPGFHISELYSPWSDIPTIARSFIEARRSPETLKTWVNTSLGETWEAENEKLDAHAFSDRLEDWGKKAPRGVLVITCGVDVQGDRLEIERVGWGMDEESWSLDHHIIIGDPSATETWRRLDAYLATPTVRSDDRAMHVRATCIDSGGQHTQAVYNFCRLRRARNIYAIKGRDDADTIWPPRSRGRKSQAPKATIVGVSVAKDAIYARLRVSDAGPGFCHFPVGRAVGWFEQLTAEVVETKFHRGFKRRVWTLPQGKRNEALDCRVYAYAALQSLSVRWATELTLSEQDGDAQKLPAPEVAAMALAKSQGVRFGSARQAERLTRAANPFAGRSGNPFRR